MMIFEVKPLRRSAPAPLIGGAFGMRIATTVCAPARNDRFCVCAPARNDRGQWSVISGQGETDCRAGLPLSVASRQLSPLVGEPMPLGASLPVPMALFSSHRVLFIPQGCAFTLNFRKKRQISNKIKPRLRTGLSRSPAWPCAHFRQRHGHRYLMWWRWSCAQADRRSPVTPHWN